MWWLQDIPLLVVVVVDVVDAGYWLDGIHTIVTAAINKKK
jgi:hypothetical protein